MQELFQNWPEEKQVQRIPGIDGRHLTQDQLNQGDDALHKAFFGKTMGPGTLACALGHRAMWEAFYQSGHSWGLMCEDDIEFDPQELHPMLVGLQQLGSLVRSESGVPWDVVSFQINHQGMPWPVHQLTKDVRLCLYGLPVTGGGCYALTRPAAKVLLDHSHTIHWPVDHFITRGWQTGLMLLGVEPRLVNPYPHQKSDIDTIGRQQRLPKTWKNCLVRGWKILGHGCSWLTWSGRCWVALVLKVSFRGQRSSRKS